MVDQIRKGGSRIAAHAERSHSKQLVVALLCTGERLRMDFRSGLRYAEQDDAGECIDERKLGLLPGFQPANLPAQSIECSGNPFFDGLKFRSALSSFAIAARMKAAGVG